MAQLVIDGTPRLEIDTLFCLPGVQNDDFFDALVDAPDIRTVVARHEQGAAYMALGAAQVTGRPAAWHRQSTVTDATRFNAELYHAWIGRDIVKSRGSPTSPRCSAATRPSPRDATTCPAAR